MIIEWTTESGTSCEIVIQKDVKNKYYFIGIINWETYVNIDWDLPVVSEIGHTGSFYHISFKDRYFRVHYTVLDQIKSYIEDIVKAIEVELYGDL